MTFTYDLTNNIGKVRRSIPDRDEDDAFWTDEDIQSILDEEGTVKLATAACLETMASDSAFILQTIQIQDLKVSGTEAARMLINRAKLLREQDASGEDNGGFDVIEMIVDDFSYRERFRKQTLRAL